MNRRWIIALSVSVLLHAGAFASFAFWAVPERKPPVSTQRLTATLRTLPAGPAMPTERANETPSKPTPELKKELKKEKPRTTPSLKQKKVAAKPPKPEVAKTEARTESAGSTQDPLVEAPSSPAAGSGKSGAGPVSGIVDVSALNVTRRVVPDYPAIARKRREQGTAVLLITLRDGKILDVRVERGSGFAMLDEAAVRAVKRWGFAHKGEVRARVPVTFKLEGR